jgi:hypothetical protein
MKKINVDHVIINAGAGGRFDCLHCGESYSPTYPVPVDLLSSMMKSWAGTHNRCKVGAKGIACHHCMGFGHAAKDCEQLNPASPQDWLDGPDTGISSKTIFSVMTGRGVLGAFGPSVPWDQDDFGRCHRLLKLFPEWRKRLGEVAERHPTWAGLVREWDTLSALYEEEEPSGRAPRCYQRMQELLRESGALR